MQAAARAKNVSKSVNCYKVSYPLRLLKCIDSRFNYNLAATRHIKQIFTVMPTISLFDQNCKSLLQ